MKVIRVVGNHLQKHTLPVFCDLRPSTTPFTSPLLMMQAAYTGAGRGVVGLIRLQKVMPVQLFIRMFSTCVSYLLGEVTHPTLVIMSSKLGRFNIVMIETKQFCFLFLRQPSISLLILICSKVLEFIFILVKQSVSCLIN